MSDYLNWGKSYHRDNAKSRTLDLISRVFGEENLADEFDLSSNEEDMNDERLYRVYGRCNVSDALVETLMRVSTGEELLEKAQNALLEEPWENTPVTVTGIVEIPKCEGCQIEACGQRDHMEHPDGCLHDPSECEFCKMDLKNLIKLSDPDNKD